MKSLLLSFKKHLKNKKLSQVSVKNYVSDVRQYLAWSAKHEFSNLATQTFFTYKSHLITAKTPTKSINRYLSSLRKFGHFLKKTNISITNPAQGLENIQLKTASAPQPNDSPAINSFKQALLQTKLKKATIKNYVSDVNQFLSWLASEKDQTKTF